MGPMGQSHKIKNDLLVPKVPKVNGNSPSTCRTSADRYPFSDWGTVRDCRCAIAEFHQTLEDEGRSLSLDAIQKMNRQVVTWWNLGMVCIAHFNT